MKVYTVPLKKKEIPYPKLRKYNSLVVLFTEPGVGTVVVPAMGWNVGDWYNSWDDSSFTDFEDEVVLSNEG